MNEKLNDLRQNVKDFFNEFKEELGAYRLLTQRTFLLISIIFLLLDFIFKIGLWLPAFICAILNALTFAITKGDWMGDDKEIKQYHAFIFGEGLLLTNTVCSPFLKMPFGKVLGVMIVIVVLALTYAKLSKFGLNEEEWGLLWEFINTPLSGSKDINMSPDDTFLGYDLKTGKPNVIPYTDRFLHFLIIGTTGTGKTSQSLIPMTFKDVENPNIGVICLDPKGDYAEQVYAYAKMKGRKNVVYFNPLLENCPYYNPLRGELDEVIENITTAFGSLDEGSKAYFQNMNRNLLVSGITVVKALYGNDATLTKLNTLFTNYKEASLMIRQYEKLPLNTDAQREHRNEIVNWFVNDYFTGMAGANTGKGIGKVAATKTFENSSGIRTQLTNLISNNYLRRVLNPPKTTELKPDEYIDFDRVMKEGEVLCMCSAQGFLRDLGQTLGMFLIQSFEASVFKRPGNEHTRKGCIFYVDEFQKYANKGYSDLLNQGRSFRVSSVLATQSLSSIAINSGAIGKTLVDLVSTNCRQQIVYPDSAQQDAEHFSKLFGTKTVFSESISVSRGRNWLSKWDIADQRETYKGEEKDVPVFTPSQILKLKTGHAICKTVKYNQVQEAQEVQLKYINKDIYKAVNEYVAKNVTPYMMNSDEYKQRKASMEQDAMENEYKEIQGFAPVEENMLPDLGNSDDHEFDLPDLDIIEDDDI